MRNTTKYTLLAFILVGFGFFIFFRYAYPYHLFHREQMLLFTYTAEHWASYWQRPAIISCLGGDFLTQFFHYEDIGAAVAAATMTCLGIAAYFACCKWSNGWIAMIMALAISGWEFLRFCNIAYPLSATISLLGSLMLFLLTEKLKGRWSFAIGSAIGILLCYLLFGYGILIYGLLVTLWLITRKSNYIAACGVCIITITLPAVNANHYLMHPSQAYIYPATAWWGKSDFENERILGLNTEDHFGHWTKINELACEGTPVNSAAVCNNLANAMQGKLPEGLMNYHQPSPLGLFMPIDENSTYLSTQLAGEIWFQLGDMTMAEHAAMLSMIFSPHNKSARMVQRLAEINLINGDEVAAQKYLSILSKTLTYRQWAKERTPGKTTAEVEKWLKEKRSFIPQSDTIRLSVMDVTKSLHLLLEANPNNKMACDYLLCFHLLMKDIPSFVDDYMHYHPEIPNRLYAEALLIHLFQKRATGGDIKAMGIDPGTIQAFNEYNQLHKQYQGNPAALESKFGKSYWFYYQFAQFQ